MHVGELAWTVPEKATFRVPLGIFALSYDPLNNFLYALGTRNLTIISAATDQIVGTLPISNYTADYPAGIATDSHNGFVYIAADGQITIINGSTNTEVGVVAVGGKLGSISYDPNNGNVYVGHDMSDNVVVVNGSTGRVVGTFPAGRWVTDLTYDRLNGNFYVTNGLSFNVSVTNGTNPRNPALQVSIPVGNSPDAIILDPANGHLFVTNGGATNVTVINGSTNRTIASVSVGSAPGPGVFDPANGYIYVTNQDTDNVSVIDPSNNAVVASIQIGGPGTNPDFATYASSSDCVYIGNLGSRSITVLAPPIQATITQGATTTETGAPAAFVANATFGLPGYSSRNYAWNFGDNTTSAGHNASVVHRYSVPGRYAVMLTVTDAGGNTAKATTTIQVDPGPMVTSLKVSRGSADIGQLITLASSEANGTPPYVHFSWSGLPPGCSGSDSPSLTCMPIAPGNYSVRLNVTDTNGGTSGAGVPTTFSIDPDPTVYLWGNRTIADVGQSIAWTASAASGSGGYQYNWTGLPSGCAGTIRVTCPVLAVGVLTVQVTVTDSNGYSTTSGAVRTNVFPTLLAPTATAPSRVEVGVWVAFSATEGGGSPPLSFAWNFGDGQFGNGPTTTHSYAAAGNYTVTVEVADGAGATSASTISVKVVRSDSQPTHGTNRAPPMFFGLPLVEGLGIILLGTAGAVGAAIALIWIGRRRRPHR